MLDSAAQPPTDRSSMRAFVCAGIVTSVVDAVFASTLNVVAYRATVWRVWQGVAAVVLGTRAFEQGAGSVALGLGLHALVAFGWSGVFALLIGHWPEVRRLVGSRHGTLKVAALYGPVVWLVMSLIVIPAFTHRTPSFSVRWWVQFVAHIPFVALPIVVCTTRVGGWRRAEG